ncbi:MAG: SDR family oxidoreductase [Cyanobacteria bacterium P01_F01_bin.143]
MVYDIQGKTIFVTGANRGIGKAIVESFFDHGAAQIYSAVRSVESVVPLVEKHGEKLIPIPIDLGNPASIFAAAEKAKDVQVVINNAGVLQGSSPLDKDVISTLEFETKINVYGLIHMAQAFAPILKANGGGVFAQLNSLTSMVCFSANYATYSASKAAAYSVTQALRATLSKQGTIVLSVHPGPIATDMGDAAGFNEVAEPPNLIPEGIIAALRTGEFHVFPDSMAKQLGKAYDSFAKNVVEAEITKS